MNTNIVETLPWIDYREVFQKIEERSKTAAQTEIALNAFRHARPGSTEVIETLRNFGVSDGIIKNAYKQVETERAEKSHDKKRSEPER